MIEFCFLWWNVKLRKRERSYFYNPEFQEAVRRVGITMAKAMREFGMNCENFAKSLHKVQKAMKEADKEKQ